VNISFIYIHILYKDLGTLDLYLFCAFYMFLYFFIYFLGKVNIWSDLSGLRGLEQARENSQPTSQPASQPEPWGYRDLGPPRAGDIKALDI